MSKSLNSDPATQPTQKLGTTSAYLAAIRLKSANKHIFRALLSLASANLLIRVAGMVNQVVVTYRFGQGESMDAYFVASTLPTLLAQLLAAALESSVIPTYARVRAMGGKERASKLFSTLLNILVVSLLVLTALMLLLRNQMILITATGLSQSSQQLAANLGIYVFPVLLFMVINSFMECLLNAEGKFGWPAYAGILVPLTTATLVLVAGNTQGVVALCVGTVLGQIIQLIVMIYRAHRTGITYSLVLDLRNKELIAIMVVAWPALFSALISQASPLVDQIFASFLSTGSISALNYANKVISVFTGVIFASVGRAMLPYLSRQAANNDLTAFKKTLRLYIWAVGSITILLTASMIVLAHPLVHMLFQRGEFTAADTKNTSVTMMGFIIGLAPMALGFLLSKAFSALGKTRFLMYVTIFSVLGNALFDYILAHYWQSFGIALATSAVYVCTMFMLVFMLRHEIGPLELLSPPQEVLDFVQRYGHLTHRTRQQLVRLLLASGVFAVGVVGVLSDAAYTLRIAFGSIIILAFLRYRYALLIAWAVINVFIGSKLPLFNGGNLLTGLTAPTLLLLFDLPIKQAFKRMPGLSIFFAYIFWVFISIAISPITISLFLTNWTSLLDYGSVALITLFVLTTRRRILLLIDAIIFPAIFISLYGLYGYFTKQNGISDTTTGLFRIDSIFGADPPTLALYLSIIIPPAIYRATTLSGIRRTFYTLVTLLLLVALALTFTRGAYISIPLSLIVMVLLLPSRRIKIAMFCSITTIALPGTLVINLAHLPLFDRFLNSDIGTLNGRTDLWGALLSHFDPTRLLGNGMNASDVLLAQLQVSGNGLGVIGTAAHDVWLEILYDHGIIGLTLLLLAHIFLFSGLFRKMRGASTDYRILLAVCVATFINVLAQSIESNDIWNPEVGVYFWIIMALPFAVYWTKTSSLTEQEKEGEIQLEDTYNNDLNYTEEHLLIVNLDKQ
jgi:murein biosynthesis integral membrane protein MurJ